MEGVVTYSYEIVTNGDYVIGIRIEYTSACPTKEEAAFARVLMSVSEPFNNALLEIMNLHTAFGNNIDVIHNADWQQRMVTGISEMETQLGAIRSLEPIESFQEIHEGHLEMANIIENLVYHGRILLAVPNDEVILATTLDSVTSEVTRLLESLQSVTAKLEDFCS